MSSTNAKRSRCRGQGDVDGPLECVRNTAAETLPLVVAHDEADVERLYGKHRSRCIYSKTSRLVAERNS